MWAEIGPRSGTLSAQLQRNPKAFPNQSPRGACARRSALRLRRWRASSACGRGWRRRGPSPTRAPQPPAAGSCFRSIRRLSKTRRQRPGTRLGELGRDRPQRVRNCSKFRQCRHHYGRHRFTVDEQSPKFADLRPMLVELFPILAELESWGSLAPIWWICRGEMLTEIGRILVDFVPMLAEFGPKLVELGPKLVEPGKGFGPLRPNKSGAPSSAQCLPSSGWCWPKPTQAGPKLVNFGQKWSKQIQLWSSSAQMRIR